MARIFFAAEAAGYFSEGFPWSGVEIGICGVERLRRFVRTRSSRIFLASFYASSLFRSKNLRAFQVVIAVDVLVGFFLCSGFARFFLARSFRDVLRVRPENAKE